MHKYKCPQCGDLKDPCQCSNCIKLAKPKRTEWQERAYNYALKNPYSIIALDPGLGKSRVGIDVREKFQYNCVVVCPGYLVQNWVKEIRKWAPARTQVTVFTAGKQIYEVCDTDYVIISYDLAQKADHLFEWCDMVIIDEGHNLKSMTAKRTQFMHKNIFENSVKRMYILTGTPLKNRVQEFYSLLALCFYNPHTADVQFLETYPSEIDFADQFSHRQQYVLKIKNKFVTVVKWVGLKNKTELKRHLHNKYIRIRSKDVLDLPPVIYKDYMVSDSPNEELKSAFDNYFRGDENSSTKPDIKKQAAVEKTPFTIKYSKDLLEEVECILIYTDHVDSAEAIAKEFGVTAITGKVRTSIRDQLAEEFQAGKGTVLVATIGSLKEGKDLFRSHHIVFNDYPWVPGDLKQVIYRIQRLGQTEKCTVHRIIGSPQDEYIMNTLEEKVKVIEKAT